MSKSTLSQPHHEPLSGSDQDNATPTDSLSNGHILIDEPYPLALLDVDSELGEYFDSVLPRQALSLGTTGHVYSSCSYALENAGPVSMDTGIRVAIYPNQPTVDPSSIHALGGHGLDNSLQPHNFGSFSYGPWNLTPLSNDIMQSPGYYPADRVHYNGGQLFYADPDMVNPPGSATVNIPHGAETSTKTAQCLTCYQCKEQFIRKDAFDRHDKYSCRKNPSKGVPCPECQKILSRPDSVKRHLDSNACRKQTRR